MQSAAGAAVMSFMALHVNVLLMTVMAAAAAECNGIVFRKNSRRLKGQMRAKDFVARCIF